MSFVCQQLKMNTSRRLQAFVGRLFSSNCMRQPVAIKYVLHSPNSTHPSKNPILTTSFFIRKNFSTANVNKVELEQSHENVEDEIPTFKEFLAQLPSQEEYVQTLMEALGCSQTDVQLIQKENLYWRSLPIEVILEHIKAFEELGVTKDDLVKNSSLLFVNFENAHKILSEVCQKLELSGHVLLPLVNLPKRRLDAYLKLIPTDSEALGLHKNRIKYFSDKLETSQRHFTDQLLLHYYLLKLPIDRITDIMDALLDANVHKVYIMRDLWVFKSNVPTSQERLKFCREVGMKDIRPWITRCPERLYARVLQKHTDLLKLCGGIYGLSWDQFVAKLLECPVEEIEAISRYDPRVKKCSFQKAKNIVDYLQSEGFTSKQILQNPQVFRSSVTMMKKRLNMLKEAGFEPRQHPEILRRMLFNSSAFELIIEKYLSGEE